MTYIPGRLSVLLGLRLLLSAIASAVCLCLFSTMAQAGLDIQGAGNGLKENLRLHLQSLPIQASRPSTQRRVLSSAREAAEALGYYQASFQLQQQGEDWRLQVTPGERVHWDAPQLLVNDNTWQAESSPVTLTPVVKSLREKMTRAAGLDHRDYEKFKQSWLQNWQYEGYWQAHYSHTELRVDLPQQQAQARLQLVSGPQFQLREITFSGSEIETSLLRRLADFKPGDTVDQVRLQQLQRNLENTNYFASVDIAVEHLPVAEDARFGATLIHVELEDSAEHWISVGAGYGTDTGVRGRLRLENPHLNRFGHRLVNDVQVSAINQEWSSNYQIPLQIDGKNPLETRLEFSASYEHEDVEGTESTVWRLGGYYSDMWPRGWRVRYGTGLYAEKEIIGDEPTKNTLYALPAVYLSRLQAPLTIDPLHGHSEALSIAGSSPTLGADTSFISLQAAYKQLFSLGGSHTFLVRLEGGVVWTDDINNVPYSQRFFAGGDQSVRGYDYNSLSVRNADGTVRGGRYLNIVSAEYSVKVLPSWRVAFFSDAGRAYDDGSEPWNLSAGIGLRWLSPIGAVRFDVAAPINNSEHSGLRLHISMGGVL